MFIFPNIIRKPDCEGVFPPHVGTRTASKCIYFFSCNSSQVSETRSGKVNTCACLFFCPRRPTLLLHQCNFAGQRRSMPGPREKKRKGIFAALLLLFSFSPPPGHATRFRLVCKFAPFSVARSIAQARTKTFSLGKWQKRTKKVKHIRENAQFAFCTSSPAKKTPLPPVQRCA